MEDINTMDDVGINVYTELCITLKSREGLSSEGRYIKKTAGHIANSVLELIRQHISVK